MRSPESELRRLPLELRKLEAVERAVARLDRALQLDQGPAHLAGGRAEEELVRRLALELGEDVSAPGAHPVPACTVMRMWKARGAAARQGHGGCKILVPVVASWHSQGI